ncbi:hypothetical protein [Gorillibacterium timonense]|uniref:hypothetical protein n=1 Tax=Gorillibacterium timonense TaxID=1689269 RepID=UPI00071C4760|nr:hypothetical protein [Gorillibacterium timonense]
MDNGIDVVLYQKLETGELFLLEERTWNTNMVAALEHINYLIVDGQEYETLEGRLNVDTNKLELLLVSVRHD